MIFEINYTLNGLMIKTVIVVRAKRCINTLEFKCNVLGHHIDMLYESLRWLSQYLGVLPSVTGILPASIIQCIFKKLEGST